MKFSIKEWRRMYDQIHSLGKMLRDSRPTFTENGGYIPPKFELSRDAQGSLESEIKSLSQRTSKYLDQCGMKPYPPLWHYDRHNQETWASARKFKYGHLLENIG